MCQKHKVDFWPSYGLSQKTEASGLRAWQRTVQGWVVWTEARLFSLPMLQMLKESANLAKVTYFLLLPLLVPTPLPPSSLHQPLPHPFPSLWISTHSIHRNLGNLLDLSLVETPLPTSQVEASKLPQKVQAFKSD